MLGEIPVVDEWPGDYLGSSVALSGDGTTALVGAYDWSYGQGAAYIYTLLNQNTKTSSTTETAFLTASDGFSFGSQGGGTGPGNNVGDEFGRVVTLSSDGSTALVGAPDWTQTAPVWQSIGKTYLHSRPSKGWLTATETAGFSDHFGEAMASSLHGNLGLVRAPGTTINGNSSQGAT